VIFLVLITGSCAPYSSMKYFNDIDEFSEPVVNPMRSATISPFSKLNILVLSTDEQTSSILNNTGQNVSGQNNSGTVKGFVVDEKGFINYPFVGQIKVVGLTLLQAGDTISQALHSNSIIKNPVVLVSFVENKITLLGEVNNQGAYAINKDFISIYESLALGGGLTQYADRKKIILLRNENNKMISYKLNLANSKIISNPLYYVLPNDILVVEPMRYKSWINQRSQLTTLLTSVTTLLSIYYIFMFRVK
jgi:polysaccharide biosynthesis/export protein